MDRGRIMRINKNIRFRDFISMANKGNYVLAYAFLSDRVYLSFSIENETFECVRTDAQIYKEYKRETGGTEYPKALISFKEKYLHRELLVEFFPNEEQKEYINSIKPLEDSVSFEKVRPLADFKQDTLHVEHVTGGSAIVGETAEGGEGVFGFYGEFADDTKEDVRWITVRGRRIPIRKGESVKEVLKKEFEGKKKSEKKEDDAFSFQDNNQEKVIHSGWSKGNSYRYILEGTGDIFRELTKPDNRIHFDYISEKIRRIEKHFKEMEEKRKYFPETGVHPEDSIQYAREHNKGKMDKMLSQWEKQPVVNSIQDIGRKLNISMIKGDYEEAKKHIKAIKNEFKEKEEDEQ